MNDLDRVQAMADEEERAGVLRTRRGVAPGGRAMTDRQRFVRSWWGLKDDDDRPELVPPDRIVDAVCDADTTKPPPGIDGPTWAGLTEHDRLEVARFAGFLRVRGPIRREEAVPS